jgi:hypothetical protein
MTVKTASVTYGRKFNLGGYNSAEIAATLWADIGPDESAEAALGALRELCRGQVREEFMRLAAAAAAAAGAPVKG